MVVYLPDETLESMDIAPDTLANAIEDALFAKANGTLHVTPKSALLPGGGRYMMATLAVGDLTVVKQVTVSPDNPSKGLPAINGAILVLDAETGQLRAVMGANWITAHRTAALSAVAAKRLADPSSEVIAFVGTGVQARSHLAAFKDQFPLNTVIAFGRGKQSMKALQQEATRAGLNFQAAETPEAALRDADIIVSSLTLDYSIDPFLSDRWMKQNALAAITDLCIPWHPFATMGTIVVDDMEQERTAEKPMLPYESIAGDLTGLVQSSIAVDMTKPRAFAFRGIALGDYAAAALALRVAEETGAGQQIG